MSKKNKSRTSFGATAPPFLDYLKDILRRYPDGGQILKELIQNADDAQATDVVFIHDERSYRTESLWADELGNYQGPALYAYNNAVFSDDDWDRIQKVGRSGKINDPNKIGRFGIGFNSVYHITDVPSIFSSGHLGLMDPQEQIFGERNGGFLWSLDDEEHQQSLMTMHDQFQPYRDIVSLLSKQRWSQIIENQYFSGTLFRFPLRNKASEISDNLYDSDKVVELFDSFVADADLSLLFLKSVSSVSLIHVSEDGTVNTRLEVKSSEPIEGLLKQEDDSDVEGLTKFRLITESSEEHKETKWLVTTCTMKESKVPNLDRLAKKLSFLPRVDLAFPLDEQRDCSQGRLSCFLPLPNNESNKTGLPVYVNACFGLTDNRRHIKWEEEDQKHDEHALWNELLVKEVLPQAYVMIIQDAIKLCQQTALPVSSVYNLWPDVTQMQHKDKWLNVAVDVFHHLLNQNMAVLSLARDETHFIPLSEAVMPCKGPTNMETLSAIERFLVSCGENLVSLPAKAVRAIEAYPHSNPKCVTPSFLRKVLHRSGVHNISKEDKLCVLEYILSDGKYRELEGLQLLPLSDGSFRSFTNKEEDTALIDNKEFPRMLLPNCKNLFIPNNLSSTCRTHLKELAKLEKFRVINMDKNHVVQYTRKHLPLDWKQTEKRCVTWDTSNSHHPPLDWLHEFWRFLNSHYIELSCFKEIPLIPVSPLSVSHPVSLAKLQQKTTLIFQKRGESSLPNQIAQLVTKAGGTVVRGNEWLKHEDLETYVLNPSPRSVMKVLLNLNSQKIIRDMKSESQTAREELKDYLSHLSSLSGQEKDLLITLPLFQTMKGSWVAAQSKQALVLTSGPDIPSELPVPDSVIQSATEADRRLLQLLKVNLLGPAEVGIILIDSIKNGTCSNQETKNIMTWILQHGDILFSQNQFLKYKCKELRFIDGKKKASDFFDPRIKTFKMILESDFFPPSVYTETPQMLQSLTHLGLINKESDLTPEHLLHVTTMIEKQKENSETEALKRGQVILEMLDGYDLLSKFSNAQLHYLKITRWVPYDQPCTERQHLSDRSTKSRFYSPEEMRHTVYEDIVGEVMPLMGRLSDRVNTKLGLKHLPPPEKVIEKLSLLKSTIQDMDDPDTNVDFKRKLHSIYSHMQQNISAFAELMDIEPDWLWAHDQFVSPRDLVLNYPQDLDLSSYIRKVPNEFLPYKKLHQKFGLRTSLSNEDIVGILHSIKQNIEARQHPFASSAEVKVSIEILNWLWKTKQTVQGDIPVPVITEDEQFTLKPKSEALLCDVSRNKVKELQFSEEEIYLLHEEIPIATAEWFKIRFLSNYILAPELIGIEQCGQSEPITTRIKNILKEYDEEGDIFKELIQNAEDAGADACKFLVDFREHKDPPENLIDPDMALCQGPCLWAFNNKQFTEDDWKNIVRVGSASKQDDLEKIGKFGLGFNTVYHVTDIPSILSGNKLLILDPNVTHLRKHIQQSTNPGIKLDLSQKRLFHCFPGLFEPYESIFDCNFSQKCPPEPYNGTLIKLPFRNEEEALKSDISKKVYHKQDIIGLYQNFTKESLTILLFLKNINALSLQSIINTIPTVLDGVETILSVSKTGVNIPIENEATLSKQCQAETSLLKHDSQCVTMIDSRTVRIVQITSQHSGETEQQYWLIYNCFGTSQSLDMVLEAKEKATYSLPIGGVAVPLQQDTETGILYPLQTDLVGQAFCFLPLPIQTGLPVNINGTFAVMSNRKCLWESGVKHEWNKALQVDPLVTAYVTALSALKKMSEKKQLEAYCYHTFWPEREKVSDTFKPLVDEFYSNLAQPSSGPELFFNGEHWCSMNNAIFLHQSIEQNDKISELAAQVCKKYIKAPNCVVPLPLWLRKSFKQAGLEQVLQKRTWTWKKFYQEAVFKNLGTMDPKTRDTLVLHAVDLNRKKIDHLLTCYPCIPTTDGKLQYISKLVNPSGKVACLFEPKDGRLLGGTKQDFCSPKRIQRLLELGMANDRLPLEDITHKACTMVETFSLDKKKAYENVKCLLELMKDHLDNKDSPHWKTLRMTQFLPAFSPSDIMMNKNTTLQKPTAVFSDRSSLLVNMIHPVLDNTGLKIHNADPVLDGLGVQKSPEPEIVLQQLEEACKHSKSADASMLHKIAYECYKFLDQWVSGCENTTVISQRANSFPFILIGNTFVNVSCVAENEQFEAEPYLHVLPRAFSSFRNLWKTVGVEKFFTTTQFMSVLREIYSQHENKALPKKELSICLTILTKGIFEERRKPTEDCLIPNEHGVLQSAKQLFYNDSPWMPVASGITLCHEHIPRSMAFHFGIKTTKHHTLENITVQNFSPFSFHFEQQEQLTVRIKNIISAYPSKKDILKELIQNADDAEATELHFIWDKRQHGKEKTFGERWNNLQGPALCVFNNKVFSDDDLKGIQQLGEGGKQNLRGKIGKYGVGFNSVYHLTDCPSILTGDKLLCISDPNQKYIEHHSDKPRAGIGYNLASGFKDMCTDVYTSFLPEKFPLKEGTMFRLPLRTDMAARDSKISHQEVTEDDMNELISALSQDPEGLILFLKNICKINVHVIDDISRNIKTILVVERTLKQESRVKKDVFAEQLKNALQSKKPITPCKTFYEISVSTSDKRQSEWIMAEQFGSHKSDDELKLTNQLPHGAIAARVNTKSPYTSLYSSNAFEGAVFCSLPLPGKTGLPVHVNGNFEVDATRKNLWKEDGQSVKLNWNESLKQLVIAPLYADLLHYIRTNINLMKGFLGSLGHQVSESYLRLWPTISTNVGPEWHQMIQEVYRSMKEKGLDVIPVLKSLTSETASHEKKRYSLDWCSLTETDSLKAPYLTDTENEKINLILETLRMKLVPAFSNMHNIWENMQSAGIKVQKVSPASVRAFLQAKPLNDPTKTDMDLPLAVTDTLIRNEKRCSELLDFCLKDSELKENEEKDLTLLDGLPLLLTKDKVLRKFNSKSPKLISIYDRLFFGYEERFADHTINGKHRVLETFNLVKKLTLPNAVEYLKPIIQRLLQSCAVNPDTGLYLPSEEMLKWLESLWWFILSEIKLETSSTDDESLTLREVKELLSDCYILPVVHSRLNNQHLLQTIKDMSSIIPHVSEKDMSHILSKLGFLNLHILFFLKMHPQFKLILHQELMDVNDKSSVLDQVCKINQSEFSCLSIDDMKAVQNFLQSGVSMSKNRQEYERKFKSLPIFETTLGERVRIDGHKEVFVLNSKHSETFPHLFTLCNSNNTFLKFNSENMGLSEMLKIKILDDLEYFMKFILPFVQRLREKDTLDCLKLLLLMDFESSKYKDEIISSLKSVKLISSSQGRLETASYYYDDSVELYEKMAPQEKFVPNKFWTYFSGEDEYQTEKLRQLVRDLGMKHKVTNDDIISFAYQLESEAKETRNIKKLKQNSKFLFREALTKVSKDKDERLLRSIADIKFIYPVKIREDLCNYHQPFASENTTVQIRGSLIDGDPKHQDLIWSSMPIIHLPGYISQNMPQKMKNAGVHQQPPSQYVTRNMGNICQSPCKSEPLIKTRADVFRRAYAYLQANDFDGHSLYGLPVVLVEKDTVLFKADGVCLSQNHDLDFRPYLYTISSRDAMYAEFFKKVGVKEKATAEQYCNVLAAIHADSCDKQKLNANQLITVKRAVQHLFLLMKNQGNQILSGDVKTLYLPAVDGKLHTSSSLYYNDTVFEIKRLEEGLEDRFLLLEKLSSCHLGRDIFEHHRLVKMLPEKLKPKMLSQITEEKVVESNMQLCELGNSCEFSGWFDKHLSSEAFKHGLICLLREQTEGKITQEKATELCLKLFGSIQIVCCESLKTMLWLDGDPLHKTARETEVFVKQQQHGFTLFLKHNNDIAPKAINEVNMTLIKEINALLGHKIASVHLPVLGQLLMCDSLQDVQKTLAKNEIRDSSLAEIQTLNPPDPGTDIPDEWHDSLDMSFLNNFEEGEYVGYSTNNTYIYAVIIKELPGQSGRCSWKYKIDIGGDEPVEVGHLDLYQFKRDKKIKREGIRNTFSMELEVLVGGVPHSSQPTQSSLPASLDEAKREIDKCLAEIWILPEQERKKAIKRLYLRWHPDKNLDCHSVATEAFKYLQHKIDELSKGKVITACTSNTSRTTNYRDFYQQWDQEAQHHRSGRERFSRSRGSHSYNFWTHNTNVPRPNREEARRWYKQARCDLNAAHADTSEGRTEWCLFKVHQAVEKALIAAEYKHSGKHTAGSSISATAAKVSCYHRQLRDLPQIVDELTSLGVDAKKTQYPNCHPYPHIPNERFRSANGVLAVNKASELLDKVDAYVN
ncbi:sacsin [Fundulus heteroclitus]|uniref:sacsin n=1 Tax=Fundulus heteroclitus TaxID=8078 RepID=UPI00165AC57F|nr:sacsin [Fundulus heteroclitus]